MDSELKVLKKIFEEKEKAHTKSISQYLGFSQDYIRFLCQRLVEKDLLNFRERDWYEISKKGKRELRLRGLIEVREKKLKKGLKKLVLPLLKLREFPKKTKFSSKIKLIPDFSSLKGKKLKLGKKIEKTASSLGRLRSQEVGIKVEPQAEQSSLRGKKASLIREYGQKN